MVKECGSGNGGVPAIRRKREYYTTRSSSSSPDGNIDSVEEEEEKDENASITAYKVHHRRPTQDPILLCFAAVVQLGNRTVRLGR